MNDLEFIQCGKRIKMLEKAIPDLASDLSAAALNPLFSWPTVAKLANDFISVAAELHTLRTAHLEALRVEVNKLDLGKLPLK
jgi:hypothetical protein